MLLACGACGAESLLLWVTHRAAGGGRTACGLAEGGRVLASPEPGDAECLACLAGEEAWAWALPDAPLACPGGCGQAAPHARWAGLLDGCPHLLQRCRTCGAARVSDQVLHLRAEGWRRGACGAPGRLTRLPAQATCLGCLEALCQQSLAPPAPDWRPEAPIAEDYYAG